MTKVAIAGPNRYAVEAGSQAVAAGGNAVDAALAGAVAAMVTEPGVASLGGGAFVTVARPGAGAVTVDGSVAMPGKGLPAGAFGRGTEHLHLAYGGGTDLDAGPGSVAVPGTLAAIGLAHRRFGRAPWAEIVRPGAELARKGFRIGKAAGTYLTYSGGPLFGRDPVAARALTAADGTALGPGDTMVQPELADFLEIVIVDGAGALNHGAAGRALVAEMAARGGLITQADLESYQPIVRPALVAGIDGWEWATNPAPAVGGPVLAAMLQLLTGNPTGSPTGSPTGNPTGRPSLAELIDVQKSVLSYRVRELDRAPDRIAAAAELLATVAGRGVAGLGGSPSTVHVSAVDAAGQACAITASSGYGAGLSVPGTGIWLNNCLGERELNRRGLHALPPGERLVSNMTPTVGRHPDGRVLAIGSPGADRISTAVLQTLLGLLAGDPLAVAVQRPRVHVSCDGAGTPVTVEYEADLDRSAGPEPGAGPTWREHPARSMFFGGVAAALRTADGTLEAAADERREGAVAVV